MGLQEILIMGLINFIWGGSHGSAKATKTESSYLNEIPLQMSPKGMWGPENMKIKNFRWGLFEFYIFLY